MVATSLLIVFGLLCMLGAVLSRGIQRGVDPQQPIIRFAVLPDRMIMAVIGLVLIVAGIYRLL
jgi:hypothetical protein